jgi:hypothetical protein
VCVSPFGEVREQDIERRTAGAQRRLNQPRLSATNDPPARTARQTAGTITAKRALSSLGGQLPNYGATAEIRH